MERKIIDEGKFRYVESGEGKPMILLHGLMGGLSNFDGLLNYFPQHGYRVIVPELPLYTLNILKTNVKSFAKYVYDFIKQEGIKEIGRATCRERVYLQGGAASFN